MPSTLSAPAPDWPALVDQGKACARRVRMWPPTAIRRRTPTRGMTHPSLGSRTNCADYCGHRDDSRPDLLPKRECKILTSTRPNRGCRVDRRLSSLPHPYQWAERRAATPLFAFHSGTSLNPSLDVPSRASLRGCFPWLASRPAKSRPCVISGRGARRGKRGRRASGITYPCASSWRTPAWLPRGLARSRGWVCGLRGSRR